TSHLRADGLAPEEDAWHGVRPFFCSMLHYGPEGEESMSPLHTRCETLEATLARHTKDRPRLGHCAAGFRIVAFPLAGRARPYGHLIFGPWTDHPLDRTSFDAWMRRLGHEADIHRVSLREGLEGLRAEGILWSANQIPQLDRRRERVFMKWV